MCAKRQVWVVDTATAVFRYTPQMEVIQPVTGFQGGPDFSAEAGQKMRYTLEHLPAEATTQYLTYGARVLWEDL